MRDYNAGKAVSDLEIADCVDAALQVLVSPDKDQVMKNLKDVYPGNTPRIEKNLQEVILDGQE